VKYCKNVPERERGGKKIWTNWSVCFTMINITFQQPVWSNSSNKRFLRFGVLTALVMKSSVVWDIKPWRTIRRYTPEVKILCNNEI
jgi:hypothetical protein